MFKTLQYGSVGTEVKILQEKLTSLGFPCGPVDGIYGRKTQLAVTAFQNKIFTSSASIMMTRGVCDTDVWEALLNYRPEEIERADVQATGQKLLWCPFADISQQMPQKGDYLNNYPEGAVIHFTAGRSLKGDQDTIGSINWGKSQGYGFSAISNTGTVFQTMPLNRWSHHAGTSSWPGLGSGLSSKLLGIENSCAGRLEDVGSNKFRSWFGEVYVRNGMLNQVRYSKGLENIKEGYYHTFTLEQEVALCNYLLWLKWNNPDIFKFDNVLGHDECSPKRKNDPGASLSSVMPKYRLFLKDLYAKKLTITHDDEYLMLSKPYFVV